MSTADWGPSAWKFLHTLTYAYPENPSLLEQTQAKNLFESLRYLLPCERCREHYEEEIAINPPNTLTKKSLSSWLVQVHNSVNDRLGKPQFSQTEADLTYTSQCSADCSSLETRARSTPRVTKYDNSSVLYVFGVLALCTVLVLVYRFKTKK